MPGLVMLAACADPIITESHQALEEDSCRLLPGIQHYETWPGTPLFAATTRRAVTLIYSAGDDRFAAYGVDVDARSVAYVMVGPRQVRDLFTSQLVSMSHDVDLVSVIAGKVTGGTNPDPRPPGDPDLLAPAGLIATATAIADAASRDPIACE